MYKVSLKNSAPPMNLDAEIHSQRSGRSCSNQKKGNYTKQYASLPSITPH